MLTEAVHILPNNVTLIRVGKWIFYFMIVYQNYKSLSFETSDRKHPEICDDDVIIVVVQILPTFIYIVVFVGLQHCMLW